MRLERVRIRTRRGLTMITEDVRRVVENAGVKEGLCTVFIRHTSASLVIQENADPDVRTDLEAFLSRLVPDGDPLFTHVAEGPDDMPAHVKASLWKSSESIPIAGGRLQLGTWQSILLVELDGPRRRSVQVRLLGG